jgi:LDH2 family malate/lactate/ureidoglycolate dehydrogenase
MAAPGSRSKVISNAPLAYAVPTGGTPVALDIAMSATAGMKIRTAARRGESIPLGWVIDSQGRPSTDPHAYGDGGALAPVGAHKGYGLALLTESLAGALSGAGMTRGVAKWLVDTATPTDAGHAFLAIDVEGFMDRTEFYDRMRHLVDELHAAEPAEGAERVLVPGDLEQEHLDSAEAEGIDLPGSTYERLEVAAERLGLEDQLRSMVGRA